VLDLLGVVPESNVLTLDDRSLGAFVSDLFVLLRRMRTLHFDAVIDCELFARISSILSFFSALPRGRFPPPHPGRPLSRFVHESPGAVQSLPAHIATVLDPGIALDSDTRPVAKTHPRRIPRIRPCSNSGRGNGRRWQRDCTPISGDPRKALVLVYPSGGILPIRAWPLEHYRSFAPRCSRRLRRRHRRSAIRQTDRARPAGPLQEFAVCRFDRLHQIGPGTAGPVFIARRF